MIDATQTLNTGVVWHQVYVQALQASRKSRCQQEKESTLGLGKELQWISQNKNIAIGTIYSKAREYS